MLEKLLFLPFSLFHPCHVFDRSLKKKKSVVEVLESESAAAAAAAATTTTRVLSLCCDSITAH